MAIFMHARKHGMKLLSLLLALAMLLSMLPAALAEESSLGNVQVIVENTTFTSAVSGVSPTWTGELINTEVELTADSTMMSCIKQALDDNDVSSTGADSGYISEIGGLKASEGGTMSGWMGTLNDWFTSEGFNGFAVANGKLEAGDLIRVMYSKDGGADLGGDWNNTDKHLKAIAFSKGTLSADFAADTHEYTLKLPSDCTGVLVTPTAANKNYQVHTYVGETEYKRTATIPVENGTVITVKCGDPEWPSMNANDGEAQVYTFTVAAETGPYVLEEGVCGNTSWKMYSNGTVEFFAVEGTDGKMGATYSETQRPWIKNHKSILNNIVLHEGVTSINSSAFRGALNPLTVSIPASMTSIDNSAFTNCTITSITAAEGGYYSVKDGFLLQNNGTEIKMVYDQTMLTGVVTIPEGVTTLGKVLNNTSITGIVFPSTLKEISANALQFCRSLESVTIPVDLNNGSVFYFCSGLKTVTIAEGVTTISEETFNGCSSLTTINIPKSLTSFPGSALNNCKSLTTVNIAEGSSYSVKDGMLLKNGTELVAPLMGVCGTEPIIPESVTSIGVNAFAGSQITAVTFPNTLKTIGEKAFYSCSSLECLTIPEGVTTIGTSAFQFCSKIETVQFPATLETIGESAFANCSKLSNLTLPSGLKLIGEKAFSSCNAIAEITIPCNVEKRAFYSCEALKKVIVSEGVTNIGSVAFGYCRALESVSLPSTLNEYNGNMFSGCTALNSVTIAEGGKYHITDEGLVCTATQIMGTTKKITGALIIPEGIEELGTGVFSSQGITSVKLPKSLKTIPNTAFSDCQSLTTVEFGEGLEKIESSAFGYCSALTELKFPSTLKTIESSAFSYCSALTSVEFPNSLTSLGDYAFSSCTALKGTLTLPASIVTYGSGVFYGCSNLEKAIINDSVSPETVNYGSQLFSKCTSLNSIRLPENITALDNMLDGCTALTSLVLPTGVKTISQSPTTKFNALTYLESKGATSVTKLSQFPNLKELVLPATITEYNDDAATCHPQFIYYKGTQEQWNQIAFNENTLANFAANGTTIIYEYDETASAENAPEILTQPANVTIAQGQRSYLTIEVKEEEGAQYLYIWYCDEKEIGNGTQITITATETGSHAYYCVVKCIKDGKFGQVKSDTVTVTVTALDKPFVGEGTQESPYQLSTTADLERLSVFVENGEDYYGEYFEMINDIELPKNWVPIGCTKDGSNNIQSGKNMNAFSGTFDGKGNLLTVPAGEKPLFAYVYGATIKDLRIYGERINGYGLINNMEGVGLAGTSVIIDNVTIESGTNIVKSGLLGSVITTNGYAGCSASYVATIKNCTIKKDVVIGCDGDQSVIGSFAGRMQGTIENCVSYATVKGTNYVGGIIGTRDNALGVCSVKNCTFAGSVIATGNNAGGIVGGGYKDSSAPNGNKISVTGCTFTGSVSGGSNVGGILGGDEYVAQSWGSYEFTNNIVTGKVKGSTNVGAMIGYYKSMNKWDNISGNQYSADCGSTVPVGGIWIIDTSCETPTAIDGVLYINTENGTVGCPDVEGCSWKTGYNRTDDPLGADVDKLFSVIGDQTLGDVNNDGEINSMDVMLTNNAVRGKVTLTDAQTKAADVNGDGEINSLDVMKINDYVRGKITAFGNAA